MPVLGDDSPQRSVVEEDVVGVARVRRSAGVERIGPPRFVDAPRTGEFDDSAPGDARGPSALDAHDDLARDEDAICERPRRLNDAVRLGGDWYANGS